MKFELKATDAHVLDVLTQKPNAEAAIYQQVKLGFDQVPESAIAAIIGAKSVGEFKQSLSIDGKPRFRYFQEIPIPREYLAKHMITIGELKPKRVTKLWKITITQTSEAGWGLEFSVQIDPNDALFVWEAHSLEHKVATISLEQDSRELFDDDKDTVAPVKTARASKNDHLQQAAASMSAAH